MVISVIQAPLVWENPIANMLYFHEKIKAANPRTDLVVLPEMFTTGFSMNPFLTAETMQGDTIRWMQSAAMQFQFAITGSIIVFENKQFYNRMVFVHPNGAIDYYDKRHLFTLAGEDKIYSPGSEKVIVEYKFWKICLQVCYDLRFPVFSRNVENYDVLIYVANWPSVRIKAWDALLRARAIENMCYVIGVNRIGTDNNKHEYVGHSQAIDFFGDYLLEPQTEEGIFEVMVYKAPLKTARKELNFLNDRDVFTIHPKKSDNDHQPPENLSV